MAILVNGVKVAGAGVPGQNATINGVNALTIEALAPLLAQMSGSTLTLSLDGGAGVHVEAGSYVGTGTYGVSGKSLITFNSVPKAAIIYSQFYDTGSHPRLIFSGTYNVNYNSMGNVMAEASVSGNTLTWYTGTAHWQMNESGVNYYYFGLCAD